MTQLSSARHHDIAIGKEGSDYALVEACIHYIEHNQKGQPDLARLARHVGVSGFHLQRLFSRWAGITPKSFLKSLTLEHAKAALERSRSVLDAALDAGLSGPGRLHDLFVTVEGVTPGEFKSGGAGLTISYGSHPSPFGDCFVGVTGRGVCALSFLTESSGEANRGQMRAALSDLKRRWPHARLVEDAAATRAVVKRAFSARRAGGSEGFSLRVLLSGTPFQIKVWQALLRIPAGGLTTYRDLADLAGSPGSARAVGRALAENPVAFLIPCPRVIHASGAVDGYRWGTARKRSMLAWESGAEEPGARA